MCIRDSGCTVRRNVELEVPIVTVKVSVPLAVPTIESSISIVSFATKPEPGEVTTAEITPLLLAVRSSSQPTLSVTVAPPAVFTVTPVSPFLME